LQVHPRDLADQAATMLRSATLTSRPGPLADAAWQAHITLVRVANRAVDGLTHLDITAALSTLGETIHSRPAGTTPGGLDQSWATIARTGWPNFSV
jgi:hypothetical protein